MRKEVIILAGLAIIGFGIVLFPGDTPSSLEEAFFVDAVYHEEQETIEVIFEDRTAKSTMVVLEILGMEESYQKSFSEPSFVESV